MVAMLGVRLALLVILATGVYCADFIPRGNVSVYFQNDNGVLGERHVSIPSGSLSQRPDLDVSPPGSIQNPTSSINFNNRHQYVIIGIHYQAVLANSSLLILRDEGDRTAYHRFIPYPEGCRATYIQPDSTEGIFFIIFEQPCSPLTIDADFDPNDPDVFQENPQLNGKKAIILEGLNIYGERRTFPTYVDDQGNLTFQVDGVSNTISRTSIGSCSVLRDLHPFSIWSATGDLQVIVDCDTDSNEERRYVASIHHNGSVVGLFQIATTDGIPLSDGHRYIAIVHNNERSITLVDVLGSSSLPEATENFNSDIMQVKFLQSGNVTSLEVSRDGRNLLSIDVRQFIATRGIEGKVERQNMMVSCDPVCNPVELMGNKFIMTAVFNSETRSYDIVYWPADFSLTAEPVRVERVSSEPAVLLFVQTGLEVVTSPPPDTPTTTFEPTTVTAETTTGSDETTTTTTTTTEPTTEPILDTVPVIVLSIVFVSVLLLAILLICILIKIVIARRRQKKRQRSLEDPPPYSPSVEGVDASNPLHFQLGADQGTGNAISQQPGLSLQWQPDPSPQTGNLQRAESVEPEQESPPLVQPVTADNVNGRVEVVISPSSPSSSPETSIHAQESDDSGRSSYNSSANSSPRTSGIFMAVASNFYHFFSSDKNRNITVPRTEPLH